MKKQIVFLFLLVSCIGFSQTENTLKLLEGTSSPKASLKEVSWIQGHWKGEAFGGITEEIWSPPLGDSMMFVFKLVVNGKVRFYEVGGIRQVEETLLLQLKHFSDDFKGWEEKEETVDLKLIKITKNKVYFDGFTIERIDENELNFYVVIGEEADPSEEVKFNYKKQL